MKSLDPVYCSARVRHGWHDHQCRRKAVRGGWCMQHHPDSVRARRAATIARYDAKWTRAPVMLLATACKRIKQLEARVAALTVAAGKGGGE